MRLLKRTLSAFLAFVMVFTMLPLQVWASETQQSANDSVNFSNIVADGADDDRALEPDGKDVDTYIFRVDGEEVSRQYVKALDKIYEPEAPAKKDHKFVGWFNEKTNSWFDADLFSMGSPNGSTYYFDAKFEPVYYVFFMDGIDDNAAVVHTQQGVTDTKIDTTFTFDAGPDLGVEGWYYDRDLTQKVKSDDTIQDQNITLYPDVQKGYWLRFDSNGGTPVDSVFMLPNAVTVKPTEPTREGFEFQHWEAEEDKEFQFGKELTESVTLKAKWQGDTVNYKVFYWVENADDNDYSLVNTVDKTGIAGEPAVNPGDTLELPQNYPDKNLANAVHYNAEKTGEEAAKTIAGDGSTIVNVYYDRNVYTIYFYDRGYNRGDLICEKEEHSHTNRCYEKRYGLFGIPYYELICGKENHTHGDGCYAIIGGYAAPPITGKYGASLKKMGKDWPTNTEGGNNWSTNKEGSGPYQANIETIPAQNMSFWVPKKPESNNLVTHTAYYYVEVLDGEQGGTVVEGKKYKKYDEVSVLYYPNGYGSKLKVSEQDRYPIQGFTINEDDSAKNGALYHKANFYYTRNRYNLHLVNTANEVPRKIQYEAPLESYLVEPEKPANVGEDFTFQGWYRDENYKVPFDPAVITKMPADNLTLYAKWDAPKFTVTVHLSMGVDGEKPLTIEVPYGGKINPNDLPKIEPPAGVESYSWATYQNGKYLSFDLDTPLYQDVTIYPYWVSNERFSVTYDLGGNVPDKVIDSKRYWGDADADIQGLPTGFKHPDGKVFLGWRSGRTGDNNLYQPGDKIQIQNANVTLTAEWGNVAQKTRLIYDANGGTGKDGAVKKSFECYNNQDVTLLAAETLGFTRDGFEFLGWATNKDATEAEYEVGATIRVNNDEPAGNTLYAVWEQISQPGTPITVQVLVNGVKVNASEYVTVEKDMSGTASLGITQVGDVYSLSYTYMEKNCADFYLNKTDADKFTGYTVDVAHDGTPVAGANPDIKPISNGWHLDNIPGGATVTVSLNAQKFTVNYVVSPDEGGTVSPTSETVPYGENAQGSTATPNEGYYFVGWKKDDGEVSIFTPKITPANVTANATYTAVFAEQKAITVTITGNTEEGTYNGQAYTANGYTVTVPEGITDYTERDVSFNGTASATQTDVGTSKMGLKAEQFTNTNDKYDVTFVVVDGSVTVNPAEVTVTADDKTKEYGGKEPTLTATVTGTIGDDTVAYTLSRAAGENVDNYTITPEGEEVQGNYKVVYKTGTLTITKASGLTFTASGYSDVYDGEEHFATATSTVPGTTFQYKVGEGEWQNHAPSIKDVGSKSVTVRAINSNYNEAETQTVELKVTPKPVTVKADDKTKIYGADDPDLTATVTGTIGKDTVTYTLIRAEGEAAGEYTITPTGAENQGNYTVTFATGTLTINKAGGLTVSGTNVTTEYNGQYHGDAATASVTEGTTISYKVGDGQWTTTVPQIKDADTVTVQVKAENPNYDAATGSYTLKVTPRNVTLTSASASKPYDGSDLTNSTVTVGGNGFVNGEGATYTVTGSQRLVGQSENTFTYTLDEGTLATNYNITTVLGTLTVTDENLPAETVVKKTHEGKTYGEGDTITYTITVKNIYNVVKKLTVTEQDGVKITTAPIPAELKPGESVTLKATYTVDKKDMVNGSFKNTVTVKLGDEEFQDDDTATFTADPKLTVEKTIVEPEKDAYGLNDTIYYQIKVTNSGNMTLENITLSDVLKVGEGEGKPLTATQPDGFTGTLAPGASVTYTASYTVLEADLGKEICNTATATGSYKDKDNQAHTVTASGSVTAKTEAQNPQLWVDKVITNGQTFKMDDTIWYEIKVTNIGNQTLKNIKVADPLTNLETVVEEMAPGDVETFNTSYTVKQDDVLAGEVVNTATAEVGDLKASGKATATITGAEALRAEVELYSATVPYDGQSHTISGGDVTVWADNMKLTGFSVTFAEGTATATGTNVQEGCYPVTAAAGDVTIWYAGEDVTEKFDNNIKITDGKLTITPKKVTLESGSATKEYNGEPLTKDGVAGKEDFVTGDVTEVKATGTQTLVGKSGNTIKIIWTDAALAKNYTITQNMGTLTVTAPETFDYVQKDANNEKFAIGEEVTFTITVTNIYDVPATVVLKEQAGMTFADGRTELTDVIPAGGTKEYTVSHEVTAAEVEAGKIANNVNWTLTPDDTKVPPVKGDDESIIKNESYLVWYVLEGDTEGCTNLDDVTLQKNHKYGTTVTVWMPELAEGYKFSNWSVKGATIVDGEFTMPENAVILTGTISKEQVKVDYKAQEGGLITDSNGLSYADLAEMVPYGENAKGATASAKKGYTFVEWQDANHKQVSTDPEFIPTNVTAPATYYAVFAKQKVKVEYTADVGGSITAPSGATFSSVIEQVTYGENAKGATASADRGYYFVEWQDAEGKQVGTELSFAPENVTKEAVYKAVFAKQTAIEVKADDLSKEYDGTAIEANDKYATNTTLKDGHKLVVKTKVSKEVINVTDTDGKHQIESIRILDANDKDVTGQYQVSKADGSLTILSKPISIEVADGVKTYGETELEITVTADGLVNENDLGEITYERRSESENAGIYTDELWPVYTPNPNYTVTEMPGTLTINKRSIVLTSYGDTKTYDGEALTMPDVEIGDVKFVDGHVEKVEAIGTQTLVGESKNTIEITWADKTVEGNYEIVKTEGTLTVEAPENLDEYVVKEHNGVDAEFKVGDTVRFTITVTNIYAVKAAVTLEEMAGMTFENGQTTLVDVLDPGQTKTYTATRFLTEQDFEDGGVSNTVKVTLDPDGEEPKIPGTDDDEVKLEEKPNMSVDKTVLEPKESYRVGDTIRYQITVTNTGNVPLHDLELTDVMNADGKVTFPTGTDLTRETLNVGDSWIVTCSYVVRAADEGKNISNTAKVISRDDDGNPNKDGEDTTPGESVQKRYSLTIHYRNTAGGTVAPSYRARYNKGDDWKVVSPIVAGYYDPQIRSISSGANGMPAQDLEYVVIYTAIPAPAPDPGPGPAPNPGPDDGDDDDDTPPAPVEPEEPADYEVDPDNYTLTEVEDNETPLANLNLDGHTCCILHLLLMLAAMVVLGFDTKSRKKHQARIFELKKMLAMEEDHSDDPEQP